MKTKGCQRSLTETVEKLIVERLIVCASWGYPMDRYDLRLTVKGYLDRKGVNMRNFKDNMPGDDWAASFLKRHRDQLAQRMCQNIKRPRAAVSPKVIKEYFDNRH